MSAVSLIAVVAAVIGAVTTIAFRSYQYDQLDAQVHAIAQRAAGPHERADRPPNDIPPPRLSEVREPLRTITGGGAPIGTVGVELTGTGPGDTGRGMISAQTGGDDPGQQVTGHALTDSETAALASVPRDGDSHTVTLADLGDYRVEYVEGVNGSFLVGVPLSDVQNTLATLIVVEICVTVAGLVAAGIAGGVLVGVALRPLRRVATTATRVSELPLHSGEVAPLTRLPDTEADPRTEVGQVGAALNRMLGHVGSALTARQESETRVRRFVADASHELRTPLASIRGYAELTRRGREEIGPDTRHALGRIEAEAERMTGLVDDLLLLARLDAGRPLAYGTTDLSPLVVDAVADARAAGQDHHWRLELPDEPAHVYGDGPRLHQVLVNLLANARTHTPPGTTVTARVRTATANTVNTAPSANTATTDGRDRCVLVDIEDDGPGIPPALLPRVFERFARGDASRSRSAATAADSTGLGLAIVHAVVTAHGGDVRVRSEPGRTAFTVRLPADTAPETTAGTTLTTPTRVPTHLNSQPHHRLTTPP
ncbi:sensor histidine kinase [Streptomyces niveus]|uniref:histidine kinase n=1 Tax=Streptomyces niveus TaxID=193462 RepID=A0A1U9QVB2_STRNV|nr:HAMP domain-containing sensor histidine kinase [Streptomyces niveus]AQU67761.1 two-component sensor histidine kinase [Streptomyces niveus]